MTNEWVERGYFSVPGAYVSKQLWDDITLEASELENSAKPIRVDDYCINRDGSVTTPRLYAVESGRNQLRQILRNTDLLQFVRNRTSMPGLIPTRCWYSYYAPGDYLGVHRDNIKSSVTLTAALTQDSPPLMISSKFREGTDEEILGFAEERGAIPEDGETVTVKYREFNALDGYNIPHWRRPVTASHVVAVLSYFDLY